MPPTKSDERLQIHVLVAVDMYKEQILKRVNNLGRSTNIINIYLYLAV
jgi:hypothetical protein